MTKLRSVGALLAISAAFSCATAINDGTIPGPQVPSAGSDSGGALGGMGDEGGGPAAGGTAEQAGQPGSAGKGVAGSATSSGGKGGSGSGSAGSGSAGKGSAGSVGVAGAHSGGSAGTSSSGGAGGSAAGSAGSGGGTTTAPCDNPKDLPSAANGNTGNFETLGRACFRTKATFKNIGCSNFEGRTLKINDVVVVCPALNATFAPPIDSWTYLDASAGTNLSASLYWY